MDRAASRRRPGDRRHRTAHRAPDGSFRPRARDAGAVAGRRSRVLIGDAPDAGRPRYRIELRQLRVLGIHGALPSERIQAQPFEIDLELVLEPGERDPGVTDELADTVDYGAVAVLAADVVRGPAHQLLESLARAMADAVVRHDPRVVEAAVTVRKLRPPVPEDLGSSAVRVTVGRPGAAGAEGPPGG